MDNIEDAKGSVNSQEDPDDLYPAIHNESPTNAVYEKAVENSNKVSEGDQSRLESEDYELLPSPKERPERKIALNKVANLASCRPPPH